MKLNPKNTSTIEPPSPHSVSPLLTYLQTGDILGVSDRTVYSLVKQGKLRAVRFAGSTRIDPADLRDFIERAKQAGGI